MQLSTIETEEPSHFMTTYQVQMNHQKSPSVQKSEHIKRISEAIKRESIQSIEPRDYSPLSREIHLESLPKSQHRYATNVKQRFHPNSTSKEHTSVNINTIAPVYPSYNASKQDLNKIASYVSNISERLSIPKLNSYGSKDRLEKYMNTQIKSPRAVQTIVKPQQQQVNDSIRNIEKLMPT